MHGSRIGMLGWSLAALCVALAAVLTAQLNWPQSEAPSEPTASPDKEASQGGAPRPAPAAAQLTIESLERYREIVERPLFQASRRPVPQEPSDTPAVAAAELRQLTLVGVLISPEAKFAIFRDKGRLETGATVGKWSVADIRDDGVTLRRGAETHLILLHKVERPQWSLTDGESQAAVPQSVIRADASSIQLQKAPTREQRFRKKRGL